MTIIEFTLHEVITWMCAYVAALFVVAWLCNRRGVLAGHSDGYATGLKVGKRTGAIMERQRQAWGDR